MASCLSVWCYCGERLIGRKLIGRNSICQRSIGLFQRVKFVEKKTEGIGSNAFGHMNKFKTNDRMNKYKLIDILIVFADKLQLVE